MKDARMNKVRLYRTRAGKAAAPLAGIAFLSTLTGCVQVSAPERPIEINLNINIRQEVVVRLTEDVRELRQREPGVF
jgi:hypothetical protein